MMMTREDLKKFGLGWAGNLEISMSMFDELESADERLQKAQRVLAAARADLRAERRRVEAKIARLWTPEEIAEAKTRCV